MAGVWEWEWHSALLGLSLHIFLYAIVFFTCAFFAARHYRRMRNPERRSLRLSADRSATVSAAVEAGSVPQEEDTLSQELMVFAGDPVPFLMETHNADDDTVQHRAGLDARFYLRFVWTMMMLFSVLAVVAICVMVPINMLTEKASWYPENSFLMMTSNGFAHPESALIFHTMFSVFVSIAIVGIVYLLRSEIAASVKGETSVEAIPPVNAYSVEVQGLRLHPPVSDRELLDMFDAHPSTKGLVLDVQVVLDVTDLVDVVEDARLLRSKLARYHEQHERDGQRPRICVGPLAFLYCGEWVDAIDHLQKQIDDSANKASVMRTNHARIATGTAFVTFKTRQAAINCVLAFQNPKKSREVCGFPTLEASTEPRGDSEATTVRALCRNVNQWSVAMATKPEDVYWRNLRFNKWHHWLLSATGLVLLVIILSFIVTPIFLIQIFLAVGDEVIDDAVAPGAQTNSYEAYYAAAANKSKLNKILVFFAGILWPLLVLTINFCLMPVLVHYSVRFFGHRQVSAMRRSAYNLICFFMVTNLLIIPGLSLTGFDEVLAITTTMPFDRLLSQILFYGSSRSFFVDYVAQAGLLTAAFYFIYHTTSPMLVDWASGGNEKDLTYEFDFAYFYSSLLAVVAIGLMFSSTVPIVIPFVAAVCVLRYYTDKWQLLTVHSTLRVDPAPEMTASASLFALLLAAALAQAAFSSWLWVQGASLMALFPLLCCFGILVLLVVPYTRDHFVVVNPRWECSAEGVAEQPESLETPAPMAYKGAYENPYLKEDTIDRTSKLWGALGGVY